MAEAADGVDSWCEAESHGFGVYLICAESGGVDECSEADDWGGFDSCESELGDDSVLVGEGDDIGDGAEGCEGEEVDEGCTECGGDFVGVTVEGCDPPGEFVGDASAAEFAEGVFGIWASWVDDGVGVGHVGDV